MKPLKNHIHHFPTLMVLFPLRSFHFNSFQNFTRLGFSRLPKSTSPLTSYILDTVTLWVFPAFLDTFSFFAFDRTQPSSY